MSLLSLHQEAIFEICASLSELEDLKVTIKEASQDAAIVGASTLIGGLLGGRKGGAIGKH